MIGYPGSREVSFAGGPTRTPTAVSLRELPAITASEWDETVGAYNDATVYHLAPWHECLGQSLPGGVVRFEVLANGEVCGHWCGFLLRRFGARVFGAPLPGSTTDYMYPLFSQQPPVGPFLSALSLWARERKVHMVELGGEYFRVADLTAHGYKTHTTHTYRVDLSGGASEVWKNLKPAMRNKIHKAEKSGVDVTHDTSCEFSGRFFDMLQSVFKRQGLTPTYGLSRVETVISTLSDSGNVVPLTAWREGEPLACVILLVDASAAYYWGGASYETAYPFGANDIIHWHAFQLAIERGLSVYDTCGGGDYKKKFGGRLVDTPAGYLSVNQAFTAVRMAVRGVIRSRSVMAGRAKHLRRKFR